MYFRKLLVANRGEIAVRIMRAARELNIAAVAVYSDADRNAYHVRMADEAYRIGPAPAAESYLRVDTIIDVARRAGVEAIHPGYGFLSERAHFAQACADAGIVFVGPPAAAIEQMGSKIASKRLAIAHDVPVVPGYEGDDQSDDRLAHEGTRIGFPLLIKASAGGGGKGMRTVSELASFRDALAGARREALAAFGNDQVLLEKLVTRARHVEIQVLGDQHGNLIYLGERECSIQRRHQKIVEESPSTALDPALRARMGEAAVRAARAVGYTNAGTVEFMLDAEGNFYFLEMNTRLQVEHPVTEAVYGQDLVHLQIAIAAGEPLPFDQSAVQGRGHAIEVRVYAEDPVAMLPSIGTVQAWSPAQGPGIRNDAGVVAGDEVTTFYDPMLAKLIVWAADRPAAILRLRQALASYDVLGVTTNIPLLAAIAADPGFAAGDTFTDFLTTHQVADQLKQPVSIPTPIVIAAAVYQARHDPGNSDPWMGLWRLGGGERRVRFSLPAATEVIVRGSGDRWTAEVDGETHAVEYVGNRDTLVVMRIDGLQYRMQLVHSRNELLIGIGGTSYRLAVAAGLSVDNLVAAPSQAAGHASLAAPMPGTIIKVNVEVGQRVAAGEPLLVMEAMKMEHTLAAPQAGVVAAVPFAVGQTVTAGTTLVELDAEEGNAP